MHTDIADPFVKSHDLTLVLFLENLFLSVSILVYITVLHCSFF